MSGLAPLVPAEVDLQDFTYMPLHVRRLRDSDMSALESPECCWAGLLLWSASWHQVPASSLPNDDRILAQLAGYGRVVKEWVRVRDGALRNFVLCEDDRWYHPVVAELALEAWQSKLEHAHRKLCDRLRKENKARKESGQPEIPVPAFDQWNSARGPLETPPTSDGKQKTSAGIPTETVLKGEGEIREKEGIKKDLPKSSSVASSAAEVPDPTISTTTSVKPDPIQSRAIEIVVLMRARGAGVTASDPRVRAWAGNAAVTDAALLTALESAQEARSKQRDPTAINAGYLDTILGNVLKGAPTYDFEALAKL